jgi:hypothetical protein
MVVALFSKVGDGAASVTAARGNARRVCWNFIASENVFDP